MLCTITRYVHTVQVLLQHCQDSRQARRHVSAVRFGNSPKEKGSVVSSGVHLFTRSCNYRYPESNLFPKMVGELDVERWGKSEVVDVAVCSPDQESCILFIELEVICALDVDESGSWQQLLSLLCSGTSVTKLLVLRKSVAIRVATAGGEAVFLMDRGSYISAAVSDVRAGRNCTLYSGSSVTT